MSKTAVNSTKIMKAPPIMNHAIVANGFVFCSGQVPMDANGKMAGPTIKERTHQCIRNLQSVLEEAGSSLDHVVEVNVFLTDMADFGKVNEVYGQYWGEIKPSRTCVAVKQLPLGVDVELKCVAVLSAPSKARL